VIPVGEGSWDQVLWLIRKERNRLQKQYLADVRFVPLVAAAHPTEPEDAEVGQIRKELHELFARR